jgi:ABC-type branched-subunit amino acid transport system substrate-binding protein
MARRPHAPLLAVVVCAGVLAACSSAPAPASLGREDATAGTAPGGTTTGGATGSIAPRTAGATGGAGTTGTTGTSSATTTGGAGPTVGTSGGTGGSTGTTSGGSTGGGVAPLFTSSEDRIGLTPTSLRLCAHAALTYANAFDTRPEDLGVFWTALNKEKGGVHGRQVSLEFYDDGYDPVKAREAAEKCIATKPFLMEGGIGFDQIPAVRNVAEQHHTLYLYHTATVKGSEGLKYSFTQLPTVERMGEGFAQLAREKYLGKRIGIVKRDSVNWEPGVAAFKQAAKSYGLNIVAEQAEKASAGNYANSIAAMMRAKADVVWVWLNALETGEIIQQMKGQNYSPHVMAFPFNLTSQTLLANSMNPPLDGVAMYPAYSYQDYSGGFASYADDMKEFERQYKTYDPTAKLQGPAGDLLFLNWTGQKAIAAQLTECGRDCTRNRFVSLLQTYHKVPTSSACLIDFLHGDRHHGSDRLVFMTTYQAGPTTFNWRATRKCVGP